MGKYKAIQVTKGNQLGVHRGGKRPGLDTARVRQSKPVDFAHVPLGQGSSDFSVVDRRAHALVSDAQGRATPHAAGVKLHVPADRVAAKPSAEGSLITYMMARDPHFVEAASQQREPLAARAVTNGVIYAVVETPVVVSGASVTAVPEVGGELSVFEKLIAGVSPEDIAATESLLSPGGWEIAESIIAAVMGPVAAAVIVEEDLTGYLVAPDYPGSAETLKPSAIRHSDGISRHVRDLSLDRALPSRANVFATDVSDVDVFVTIPAAENFAAYEDAIAAVFGPADGMSSLKTELSPKATLKELGGHINFLAGWTTDSAADRTKVMTWLKSEAVKPLLTKLSLTPGGLAQKLFAKAPNLSSPVIKLLVDLRGGKISVEEFNTAVDNLSEDDFKVKQADLSGGMSGGKGQNPQRDEAQAEASALTV